MSTRFYLFLCLAFLFSCKSEVKTESKVSKTQLNKRFVSIPSAESGINFNNEVTETSEFNHLKYIFFYNGGGVAAGDIDNDGLTDIYFSSNQGSNALYINNGEFKFEDITDQAGVSDEKGWTTGVSMVDVNGDGFLDIYVCKAGAIESPGLRKNKLFINNQDRTFTESAAQYGLDDPAFSSQAYFFDYDKDSDLDLYLVNHRFEMTKQESIPWKERTDGGRVVSDQLYRNDGGSFTNVTSSSGLENNCWGHSASIVDFNEDGWPDIYVCNDFREPDHYYVNDGKGHFQDKINSAFGHISHYSMGSDIGDLNNDGLADLIVMDMTPEGHARSKENMTQMNVADFNLLIDYGYPHQYMSNSVQLNRGNGAFSEISNMLNMASTDWSWGPLIADFDNDGLSDVFVSNGVKIDMNNRDYYTKIKRQARSGKQMSFSQAIAQWPSETVTNYMFNNKGELHFNKVADDWGLGQSVNSNGATYADLDNDGDLDLIWNNSHQVASIYRNDSKGQSVQINLKGDSLNRFGIGAQVNVKTDKNLYTKDHYLAKGYLSSVDPLLHFGLAKDETLESVSVRWSDGSMSEKSNLSGSQVVEIEKSLDKATMRNEIDTEPVLFTEVNPKEVGFKFQHLENDFDDYKSERLLPQKQSTLGPHISYSQINKEGKSGIFIAGALGQESALYVKDSNASFEKVTLPQSSVDKEDISSMWIDANNDEYMDLLVLTGGNEFDNEDERLLNYMYLQNEDGSFRSHGDGLPYLKIVSETACQLDFDSDGDMDIFMPGRLQPGAYPYGAGVHLLENINGSFAIKDLPGIRSFRGRVTEAKVHDLDDDGDQDIVMVGEWMPITILRNTGSDFEVEEIKKSEGWWYALEVADLDSDGQVEIIAGNLGLNNKFHASEKKPFHVYANDFDDNGTLDIVLSKESQGMMVPVRGKDCSTEQMPFLANKFPSFKEFAAANLQTLYGHEKVDKALHLKAHTFASAVFWQNPSGDFVQQNLPPVAQFGPTQSILILDVNGDNHPDIIGAGGVYNVENETARYDANLGYVLYNNGEGSFIDAGTNHGFRTNGNVKDMELIELDGERYILVSRNNDTLQLFKL